MVSSTRRTAGCGPACPVVWQGRVGDHSPYADSSVGTGVIQELPVAALIAESQQLFLKWL
jgi:hypothetical protein